MLASVNYFVLCSWSVAEVHMEPSEVQGPTRLPLVGDSCCGQVLQVVMIGIHQHWVSCSLEVMPPFFKGRDQGQEFLIHDRVVAFHRH